MHRETQRRRLVFRARTRPQSAIGLGTIDGKLAYLLLPMPMATFEGQAAAVTRGPLYECCHGL
jgi:hypothetical protein